MSGPLLLVDDCADDAELFRVAAKKAGLDCEIRWSKNGEDALDLLLKSRLAPALVLLDIKLTGMNGLEVLRRLREDRACRSVVVVILSGSDLESDRVEALKIGCSLYLVKPSSFKGYLEVAGKIKGLLS